jgi:hypothetical protein
MPRDPQRAGEIAAIACAAGVVAACELQGRLQSDVAPERAAGAFLKACDSGDRESCERLLGLMDSGRAYPVPSRERRAFEVLCKSGDDRRCGQLKETLP